MRTKRIILTMLIAFITTAIWAQEANDAKIIVWLKDGTKTEILFNQMPEFLYADGNVSLQNSDTQLSWPLSNLQKFTFEDVEASKPTGIKDVKTTPKLDIAKGCVVYDLSGKLVKRQIRSLSELPKGTYILKDGSVTTKVVKR